MEGGEIGSGSSVMAVFQVTPNSKSTTATHLTVLANLELKYSLSNDSIINRLQYQAINNFTPLERVSGEFRFATAVTSFGLKLKFSNYYEEQSWSDIIQLAKSSAKPDVYLQNEFITLLTKAQKLYKRTKRNKRNYE
jgi:Ca-activated chloride channel family protein